MIKQLTGAARDEANLIACIFAAFQTQTKLRSADTYLLNLLYI